MTRFLFYLSTSRVPASVALLISLAITPVGAQQGDKKGEVQQALPSSIKIPPAPPLTAADEQQTFKLAPGFRIELVAAEPMVKDPVAMAFDPDGRLWVVEMSSYMPTVDAEGEDQPIGTVAVLEDTDGDGRMDKRTEFATGLVLPRAICLTRGGALIAAPPDLYFMRDSNGDGMADEKTVVDPAYATKGNPEHLPNGLLLALDNWIYNAKSTARYRFIDDKWMRKPTAARGQWGMTQDNWGRLYYNYNSDQLRGDFWPDRYLTRNPNFHTSAGVNVQLTKDQSTWPARVNTGVNRGYKSGQLREDGRLATYTAVCGPVIYRGGLFPAEFNENAFVCEPAGNLVTRDILTEKGVQLVAAKAYPDTEFLTSTDERFRPVNAYNGPDGGLYIIDLYRGVIQHKTYVTSFLRGQILSRNLEQPVHLGRIWRVVPEGAKPGSRNPGMSKAKPEELVARLSSGNGWTRDTAQRLLVEGGDTSAAPALKKLAATGAKPLPRLQALWTLEGMGQLDEDTVLAALDASEPNLRANAVRLAEPFLAESPRMLARLIEMTKDPAPEVQVQLAFSLGETKNDPQADVALMKLLQKNAADPFVRDAVMTSIGGRELEFLQALLSYPGWASRAPEREATLTSLARCVLTQKNSKRVATLVELIAAQQGKAQWKQAALLESVGGGLAIGGNKKDKTPKIKTVSLDEQPAGLARLRKIADRKLVERVKTLDAALEWPGKPGMKPKPTAPPLTAAQQKLFDEGKELYTAICAACHQPTGQGQEGLGPPLVDSEWVTGPEGRPIRIVLNGVAGEITVDGRIFTMEMPALNVLTDDQIAAALTYIRREWGHIASPVHPETVKKIRASVGGREEAWSPVELSKLK